MQEALRNTELGTPRPGEVSETEELFVHVLRRIVHAKIARRDGQKAHHAR